MSNNTDWPAEEPTIGRRQALALGASALAWQATGTVAAAPGKNPRGYDAGGYGDGGYGK